MTIDPSDPSNKRHLTRRQVLQIAAALPVVGTIVAIAVTSGDDSIVSAQTGAGTPEGVNGTPIACASPIAGSPIASPVAATIVRMTTELRFDPEHITITAGDTVRWDNVSNMPHTATDDPAMNPVATSHPDYVLLPDGAEPWSSELLMPGDTYAHTFTVAGDYNYFCIPHVLSGMRGTITVAC